MNKINLIKLNNVIPKNVLDELPNVIQTFKIDNIIELSHFLGQCSHESSNFIRIRENLNYSTDGLLKIFKKYFPNKALALKYHRQPEKIANYVYSNRMGNGNEHSGDGWKFRGRGFIQLTGKNNYINFDKYVPENIIDYPDLVATKYPLLSAGYFWGTNNINSLCKDVSNDTITLVTGKVNGGTIGLQDRINKTLYFYNILK